MFIVPSIDDGQESLLCSLSGQWSCWWNFWLSRLSIGRETRANDSTGEGQDVLGSLTTNVVREELLKHRPTYLSLLVRLQPKRLDAIDHRSDLEIIRQDDSDELTGKDSFDIYRFLIHVFFPHLFRRTGVR